MSLLESSTSALGNTVTFAVFRWVWVRRTSRRSQGLRMSRALQCAELILMIETASNLVPCLKGQRFRKSPKTTNHLQGFPMLTGRAGNGPCASTTKDDSQCLLGVSQVPVPSWKTILPMAQSPTLQGFVQMEVPHPRRCEEATKRQPWQPTRFTSCTQAKRP